MSPQFVTVFWIAVALGIIILIIKAVISFERDGQEAKLRTLGLDFKVDYKFFGWGVGIALDHSAHKIGVMLKDGAVRIYDYKDIVSVERVRRDGQVQDRVARGNQLGRAVVGGAIFGVAGAAVGAVSARRVHTAYVSEVGLRIIFDDVSAPVFDLKIAGKHAKGGFSDKMVSDRVEECYAQLLLAMRRADAGDALI